MGLNWIPVNLVLFFLLSLAGYAILDRRWKLLRVTLGLTRPDAKSVLLAVAAGMLFSLIVLAPFFWQVELQANGSSLTYEKFIGIGLTPATLLAAFAWAFLHQGLPEEMFFRGFLLGQLTRRFRPLQTNVIQAVVFWLLHFPGFILLGRAVGSGSGIKTTAWPDRC